MKPRMNVLVACEYSGRVRKAFSDRGHNVWSADFEPADDDSPFHYKGDCFDLIDRQPFDPLIAHPPCTYLSVSGMHWTTRGLRDPQLTEEALAFVRRLMGAPIRKKVIENPVSVISTRIRKPDQVVQPHEHGEDASKKTCLWLENLPKLVPTKHVPGRLVCCGKTVLNNDRYGCPNCGGSKTPKLRGGTRQTVGRTSWPLARTAGKSGVEPTRGLPTRWLSSGVDLTFPH